MFFRSIRSRLTLLYALPLAALLAASGFFWHYHVAENLLNSIDERLFLIAEDISGDLQRLKASRTSEADLCVLLRDFIDRHRREKFVQVLEGDGQFLCASASLGSLRLPLTLEALQHSHRILPYFEDISTPQGDPVRLLTYPVAADSGLENIIQVGVSRSGMAATLADLRFFFFVFSPLVLLLLAVGGWYLAGRALSPMVRMARAAHQITADNLSLRLPVEQTGDEIALLAENFNSMLGRLEKSFRRVKQFSGDASHELRTPLAILRGETEVTLRWARSVEDYRRTLESNLEEINRMGRIIEDLLTLAKSDAGELPLEIRDISLSDLLQELYLQGNTLGESKNISVLLHLDVAEEIRIRGDELRLRQIILNLISNGIKYNAPGGRVDIALSVQGEEAVIRVSDTGIGIPEEHIPHIFDRFYRIDKARNRADGGTGLGLAISKSIVEAHAGRIIVESGHGQGSIFTVFLPLEGPSSDHLRRASEGPYCAIP